MQRLIDALKEAGAKRFISYGLVLKNGSRFVPTYFGTVIDDKDRAYFELDEIPNNRLHDKKPMIGILRSLSDQDAEITIGDVGAPFEEICVGDLLYDKETRSSQVYGYEEKGKIIAFISFRKHGQNLFIDAVGTVVTERERGIASAMLRWAETWARSMRCTGVELWAYEGAIDVYTQYSYEFVDGQWHTLGAGHRFKLMRKKLLYNIKVTPEGEIYREY